MISNSFKELLLLQEFALQGVFRWPSPAQRQEIDCLRSDCRFLLTLNEGHLEPEEALTTQTLSCHGYMPFSPTVAALATAGLSFLTALVSREKGYYPEPVEAPTCECSCSHTCIFTSQLNLGCFILGLVASSVVWAYFSFRKKAPVAALEEDAAESAVAAPKSRAPPRRGGGTIIRA